MLLVNGKLTEIENMKKYSVADFYPDIPHLHGILFQKHVDYLSPYGTFHTEYTKITFSTPHRKIKVSEFSISQYFTFSKNTYGYYTITGYDAINLSWYLYGFEYQSLYNIAHLVSCMTDYEQYQDSEKQFRISLNDRTKRKGTLTVSNTKDSCCPTYKITEEITNE